VTITASNQAQAILEALTCGRSGPCECKAAARRGKGRTHCPVHADPSASLAIETKPDGTVVWKCHANCPQPAVTAALIERQLYTPRERQNGNGNGHTSIVATYDYRDEHGALLHRTVRKAPKGFSQCRPDGRGGWIWNLQGARLVLFRLQELLAADPTLCVYIVEGEKDAERLAALGLVATTAPMGAGKWRDEYAQHLAGRDVVILPDNDQAGRDHAATVAKSLKGVALRVRVIQLPGLPEKGDPSDWFDSGHSVQDLLDQVELEPEPERAPRRFRFLNSDELKNRPDPEWQVEDVLQRDTLALLVGMQETFKSFIAVDLAMAVGTGRHWQGHAVQPAVVAYVSAEGGSGLPIRIEAWKTVKGHEQDQCFFLADQAPQFLDRKIGGDVDELLLALAELPEPPGLVVIDTAARAMVGGDENSAQDMGLFIDTAEKIRQATHATVLIVHHFNKAGAARGSTALLGAVHTIIECSREKNSRHVLVQCGKQKDGEHFTPMILEARVVELGVHPETGRLRTSLVMETRPSPVLQTIYGKPAEPKLSTPTQAALAVLADLGTVGFAAWRDATTQAKSTFHRSRTELISAGYVEHTVDGHYQVTEKGRVQGSGMVQTGSNGLHGPSANGEGPEGPPPLKGVDPGPTSPDPAYKAWQDQQDLP
jgi:hypothetical protein